ncbi:MAG TPA: hypothetical protein ENI33_09535 [Thermoplasmatales archaeon]|nr:hypothetical protein [Thermoplasmatales archaeon]
MKGKIKRILKEIIIDFKKSSLNLYGIILIFFIFIPGFAFYAWLVGVCIRVITMLILGYEPIGMNWFVYGIVAGGVSSMIVQGIHEGKKSFKELFRALLTYFSYFGLIFVALVFWTIIIWLLKNSSII